MTSSLLIGTSSTLLAEEDSAAQGAPQYFFEGEPFEKQQETTYIYSNLYLVYFISLFVIHMLLCLLRKDL